MILTQRFVDATFQVSCESMPAVMEYIEDLRKRKIASLQDNDELQVMMRRAARKLMNTEPMGNC